MTEKEDYSLEEELEKELYGQKKSERIGRIKKIWGIKTKSVNSQDDWQEDVLKSSIFSFWEFNLKKFFLISFILFLLSIGIFGFVFYYRSVYIKGIDIEIIGPVEVNTFQPYEYTITVNNNSNSEIQDAKLIVKLDEGLYFFDKPDEEKLIYNLGTIQAKDSKEFKIKLFFSSSLGKNLNINTELYYLSPNKNQTFSLTKNLLVNIKKEPISFQIFIPNQVFSNEPFFISFKFTNISDEVYDLIISLDSNPNLETLVVEPPYGSRLSWEFNQLTPNTTKEINITAKITQNIDKAFISFKPEIIYRNRKFSLKDYNLSLNIVETPLRLFITSKPEEYTIGLNKYLNYEISWENKSKVSLNNVQLKAYLLGNFDFDTLNSDGYYSPIENSIIWNSRNKPELSSLTPGSKGNVSFNLKTVSKYPPGKKNLDLIVKAVIETETIPPEVQILTKKLSIETQHTKIIPGELEVKTKALYDSYFLNTGPFPLKKGEQTTLTVYFDICTFGEDFQNIIIKGKIPLGVNLTGNFDTNFDTNNLQFDSNTGNFHYNINELGAGYCDIYPAYQLAFQIAVTPPLYGDINKFIVLPSFEISAQGKYSQNSFEIKTQPLSVFDINSKKQLLNTYD